VSLADLKAKAREAIEMITSVTPLSAEEAARALHLFNWCACACSLPGTASDARPRLASRARP